jgi:hypothetical protein
MFQKQITITSDQNLQLARKELQQLKSKNTTCTQHFQLAQTQTTMSFSLRLICVAQNPKP